MFSFLDPVVDSQCTINFGVTDLQKQYVCNEHDRSIVAPAILLCFPCSMKGTLAKLSDGYISPSHLHV